MVNISKEAITITLSLLFIVTITTLINTNNGEITLHTFSHSLPLPLTTTQPPSHAPAPSPTHHHHHTHHHVYRPSPQPSQHVNPSPQPAAAKPPTRPVTTLPPVVAKPPSSRGQLPGKPVNPPVRGPSTAPIPVVKRKFVAVQGMVYCKSNCSFTGVDTLFGASPLPGARVILRCKNTKYILRKTATTDKNGYFFLEAPQLLTTYGAHKCKVYLAHHRPNTTSTGPMGPCSNASDLNNGSSGAYLFSNNTGPPKALPTFSLFSVGPFAYESTKCHKK